MSGISSRQPQKKGRAGALVFGWGSEAAERLRAKVDEAGGPQVVANEIGISRSSLYALMAPLDEKRATPSQPTLKRITEVLQVAEDFFTKGNNFDKVTVQGRTVDLAPIQLVPIDDAFASAGDGAEGFDQEPVDYIGFPRQWLRAQFGDADELRMLTVRGDSMSPRVPDGALIMYDPKKIDAGDGVYVVRFDDHLMAKRLQHGPGGQITVASDNPLYASHTVSADEVTKIGRVIWVASSL